MEARRWQRYLFLRRRMRQDVVPEIRSAGYEDLAKKLELCGIFINTIRCLRCDTRHFAGYQRCKNRFCLPCSHVRSMLYISRIVERMREIEGHRYYFLTLTLRDMENLSKMINMIRECWLRFYNTDKEIRKKFKQRFDGYIKSIEVKRGSGSGKWHVHIHMLLSQDENKEFEKDYYWIKEGWKKVTKGEGSVFIKQAKGEVIDIALELVKYILKPGEYKASDYEEIIPALEGVRQISTGGIFRGMNKQVEYDMDHVEEKKLEQFICSRCGFDIGVLESIEFKLLNNIILYDSVDY